MKNCYKFNFIVAKKIWAAKVIHHDTLERFIIILLAEIHTKAFDRSSAIDILGSPKSFKRCAYAVNSFLSGIFRTPLITILNRIDRT